MLRRLIVMTALAAVLAAVGFTPALAQDGGGQVPNVTPLEGGEESEFPNTRDASRDQYGGKGKNRRHDDDDDDDDDTDGYGYDIAWVACFNPPGAVAPVCFPCPPPFLGIPIGDPRNPPICATAVPTRIPDQTAVKFLRNLGNGGGPTNVAGTVVPLDQAARLANTAGQAPTAAVRPATAKQLPFTGFNVLLLVLIGSGLIAVGMGMRAGGRLRAAWDNRG